MLEQQKEDQLEKQVERVEPGLLDGRKDGMNFCCPRQPPAFPRLSLIMAASPSLLISATSIDLLHTSVSLLSSPLCLCLPHTPVSLSPVPTHQY